MPEHITVLQEETVHWLSPHPSGRYLDGTLGLGGHTLALLKATGGGAEVLGIDRDAQALEEARKRLANEPGTVHFAHTTYSSFPDVLQELGWESVDGAVLDLGVSSLHLDDPERGFSFMNDGPLDMRMGAAEGREPARNLVNRASYDRLKQIIRNYGEEPMAGRIASRIVKAREKKAITTTLELAGIVEAAYPPKRRATAKNHPATKTFQALRIAVNGELEELGMFLDVIPNHLAAGARVAVISFHSLEDRMVKRSFKRDAKGCICPPTIPLCTCDRSPTLRILTKKPVTPTQEEMDANPRSRSAKLRVAERLPIGESMS